MGNSRVGGYELSTRVLVFSLALLALTGQGQSAQTGGTENAVHVEAQADRLTVRAMDVPLAYLLQKLAEKIDVVVHGIYDEPRLADERITVEFHDLTVEEGIRRILTGYSSVLMFSGKTIGHSSPRHRLSDVWVLLKGVEGLSCQESSEKGSDCLLRHQAQTGSPDPSIRRMAVEAMDEGQDLAVIPEVQGLLNDPDQSVRLAAFETLRDLDPLASTDHLAENALSHEDPQMRIAAIASGLPLPNEVLVDHALHDPDPQVRIDALQALEGEQESENVTKQALNDPDSSVQAAAKEILQILETNSNLPAVNQHEVENIQE